MLGVHHEIQDNGITVIRRATALSTNSRVENWKSKIKHIAVVQSNDNKSVDQGLAGKTERDNKSPKLANTGETCKC